MFPSKSCYMSILLLASCAAYKAQSVALDSSGIAADAYTADAGEERSEGVAMHLQKRPSFFVGSRYGRSGASSPLLLAPSKARRLNMVPRNDRFFLGSRYGKRSGEYMSPYEQDAGNVVISNNKSVGYDDGNAPTSPYMMSCVYTGLRNLYRCNSVEEINNIINQLTTAQTDDDRRK